MMACRGCDSKASHSTGASLDNLAGRLVLDPKVLALKDPKMNDPRFPLYMLSALYGPYKLDSKGILYIPSMPMINQEPVLTYKKGPSHGMAPSFEMYMQSGIWKVGPRDF